MCRLQFLLAVLSALLGSQVSFGEPPELMKIDKAAKLEADIARANTSGITPLDVGYDNPLDLSQKHILSKLEDSLKYGEQNQRRAAMWMIAASAPYQTDPAARKNSVNVMTRYVLEDSRVGRHAESALHRMSKDDFTKTAKTRLERAFRQWVEGPWTQSKGLMWVVGAANVTKLTGELGSLLVEDEYLNDAGWYRSKSWHARLALGRMGNEAQIDYIVHAVRQADIRHQYGILPYHLGYVRSRKVVELLYELLMQDSVFRDVQGMSAPVNHSHVIGKALYQCVVGLPSPKFEQSQRYTKDELEKLRQWMTNNQPWKIKPR